MSEAIITVANLGKRYCLNHQQSGPREGLRHVLNRWAAAPFRVFQKNPQNAKREKQNLQEDFWALKNVSFEIKQGEVVGVIGRNGAGKSTLLKILSRITEPTEGRVHIKGRVASLLEVGTGFHPELTGRENIFLNGAILGMSRLEIKSKFDEIVAFAEVQKFLDTPVKRYSSGMYVRLAFAVAAHLEPEILIVDEVLAVGDAEFQKKCLGKMASVAQNEGRTILFVSHNMPAVSKLTRRCLVMSKGTVASDGPTQAAVESYLQTAVPARNGVYQLSDAPRSPGGTNAAKLISAAFHRSNPYFQPGEDLEFSLRLRANEDVAALRFSMTVCSLDGTPIGTTYSRNSIHVRVGESRELHVRLPKPGFAPGHYCCIIAIGSGSGFENHIDFDVVPDTLHFEVGALTGRSGAIIRWNDAWGKMLLPDAQLEEPGEQLIQDLEWNKKIPSQVEM